MRNQYRSIIDLNRRQNPNFDDYDTETSKILVSNVPEEVDSQSVCFLEMHRFGKQLTYAYLTDDEVTDLIGALTWWRANNGS